MATIGQLLLDQIQGALSAGRRRRGVVIGAIAIGTSIAILIFVSNVGKSLVYTVLGVFFNGALVAIATQTED